jgi:hypothetical protein
VWWIDVYRRHIFFLTKKFLSRWSCLGTVKNFLLSYSYFMSLRKYICENCTVSCVRLLRDCSGRTRRCHISLRNYSEQVWRIGHSCACFSSNNMPLGYVALYPGLFVFRFSTLPCFPNPCTSPTLPPPQLPSRLPATEMIHSFLAGSIKLFNRHFSAQS